jgi:hypothetical protein
MLWFEADRESLIKAGVRIRSPQAGADSRIKVWRNAPEDRLMPGDESLPIREFRRVVNELGVRIRVVPYSGLITRIAQFAAVRLAGLQVADDDVPPRPDFPEFVAEVCERAGRAGIECPYATDVDVQSLVSLAEEVYRESLG